MDLFTAEAHMTTLNGIVDSFFETGCEGLMWIFYEDGKKGWDGFNELWSGDHLTVFAEDGSTIFEGVISRDTKAGYRPYPMNPDHGQPCALGYWVHWTQRSWKPDDWARLFIRGKGEKPLRAKLIKAKDYRKMHPDPKKKRSKGPRRKR